MKGVHVLIQLHVNSVITTLSNKMISLSFYRSCRFVCGNVGRSVGHVEFERGSMASRSNW
jgi:hypothetical protein